MFSSMSIEKASKVLYFPSFFSRPSNALSTLQRKKGKVCTLYFTDLQETVHTFSAHDGFQ